MTVARPTIKVNKWAVVQFQKIPTSSPKQQEYSSHSLTYEITHPYKNGKGPYPGAALAERSYPTSEVRGSGQEDLPHVQGQGSGRDELPHVQGQWQWPRGATPRLRSGAAAEGSYPTSEVGAVAETSYPTSEVRGSSDEEQPQVKGAVAAQVQEG